VGRCFTWVSTCGLLLLAPRWVFALEVVYPDTAGYVFSAEEQRLIQSIADAAEEDARLVADLEAELRLEILDVRAVSGRAVSSTTYDEGEAVSRSLMRYTLDPRRAGGVTAIVKDNLRETLLHLLVTMTQGGRRAWEPILEDRHVFSASAFRDEKPAALAVAVVVDPECAVSKDHVYLTVERVLMALQITASRLETPVGDSARTFTVDLACTSSWEFFVTVALSELRGTTGERSGEVYEDGRHFANPHFNDLRSDGAPGDVVDRLVSRAVVKFMRFNSEFASYYCKPRGACVGNG
jgi:hypothetical protein